MTPPPIDTPFTALVLGAADYQDTHAVCVALDSLTAKHPNVTILIDGAQSGVSHIAQSWAINRQRPYISDPRGMDVLLAYLPHGAVCFPGGIGTADMCRQAERAELRVWYPAGRA